MEEFKDHYEKHHIRLFDEHVSQPGVLRYARRYLTPMSGLASSLTAPQEGTGYDVIMEVWYSDAALFEAFRGERDPGFGEIVGKDEEKLFDRESMVMYLSEDWESKEGPWDVERHDGLPWVIGKSPACLTVRE